MTGNCEAKPRAWRYCRETAEKLQMSLAVSKNRTLANSTICRVGKKKLQETAEKLQNVGVNKIKGLASAKEKLQETAEKLQAQNVSTAHPAVVCCSIACSPEGHAYAHEGAQTFLINLSCRKENEMARNSNLTPWPTGEQGAAIQIGCSNQIGGQNAFPRNIHNDQLPRPTILLRRYRPPHSKRRSADEPGRHVFALRDMRRSVRVHDAGNVLQVRSEQAMQSASAARHQSLIKARFFGTAQKAFLNRSP